jgi:hypothetical protein
MKIDFSWVKWFLLALVAFVLGVVGCYVWVIIQLIPG